MLQKSRNFKIGVDKTPSTCYNKEKRKEMKKMRKAILDGVKVVGFEQVKEELKPEAQKAKNRQVEFIMKKYGFKK